LTGVDSSPELLDAFRRNVPEAEAIHSDMRDLRMNRRFSGLFAWDSVFHLSQDDQRRMFCVFAAHAAPGSALLFNSGPVAGTSIGTFEGEPLYHASLDAHEYRRGLDGQGFELVAHWNSDPDCGGRTIWLFRRRMT
jgi:hypothetical protein